MSLPASEPRPPAVDRASAVLAPKVLLHDHLDGGLRPATVLDLARESGYGELPAGDVDGLARWFRESADSGSLVRYLETYVYGVKDHKEYLEVIG